MLDILRNETTQWYREPPAPTSVLEALQAEVKITLPADYLIFLEYSNGGEGRLGMDPGRFQIWPAQEVVQLNRDYEVQRWLPHLLGFGSDGGGKLLAFEIKVEADWPVCMVPFGDLTPESIRIIAPNFAALIQALGREPNV